MRRPDQLRRADRLRSLGAGAYSERDKRWFLMVAMKRDEIRWFGDAPEDRDMTQMEFMRLVMQRFLENAPARLPTDREVLTLDYEMAQTASVDDETMDKIEAECQRLSVTETDLVRYALLKIRDEDQP
jgi:hypothetical protein